MNKSVVINEKAINQLNDKVNTKQDALTFVGTAPEVMKKGAFGLGKTSLLYDEIPILTSFYSRTGVAASDKNKLWDYNQIVIANASEQAAVIGISPFRPSAVLSSYDFEKKDWRDPISLLTESDITQKFGTSKTLVASQYLIDLLQKEITKYSQRKWSKPSRLPNTIYTNTDSIEREIIIFTTSVSDNAGHTLQLFIDDVLIDQSVVGGGSGGNIAKALSVSATIPAGSKYTIKVTTATIQAWSELSL